MSAVADVVRAVNAAEPLDELLGRVAEQVCRLVGFDSCAVMLPDDAGEWLAARGSHGLPAEYVDELNRSHALVVDPDGPEADTLAARAFREAVTLTVSDAPTAITGTDPSAGGRSRRGSAACWPRRCRPPPGRPG